MEIIENRVKRTVLENGNTNNYFYQKDGINVILILCILFVIIITISIYFIFFSAKI